MGLTGWLETAGPDNRSPEDPVGREMSSFLPSSLHTRGEPNPLPSTSEVLPLPELGKIAHTVFFLEEHLLS